MKLSNKTYDILKDIATIWLPAIESLVAAIWAIWGLPYSQEITGTIVAVMALLNTILGFGIKSSSKVYWQDLGNE